MSTPLQTCRAALLVHLLRLRLLASHISHCELKRHEFTCGTATGRSPVWGLPDASRQAALRNEPRVPASPDPVGFSAYPARCVHPAGPARLLSGGVSSPLSGNPDPAQGSPPALRGASRPPDAVRLLSEGVSSPLSMDTASSAPGRGYVGNAAHQHRVGGQTTSQEATQQQVCKAVNWPP